VNMHVACHVRMADARAMAVRCYLQNRSPAVTWARGRVGALRLSAGGVTLAGMTAQPVSAGDPEDPAAILGLLPERWHEEFLAEYRHALEVAREVRRWPFLAELLHRWHLRAVAYSDPEFSAAVREARDARPEDLIPVPGWPARQ
jgi:hypothetical protein